MGLEDTNLILQYGDKVKPHGRFLDTEKPPIIKIVNGEATGILKHVHKPKSSQSTDASQSPDDSIGTEWVEKSAHKDPDLTDEGIEDPQYRSDQDYIETLAAALHNLIGPPDSAAKSRVRESSDNNSFRTIVTKFVGDSRHPKPEDCTAQQTNFTVHMVMQYLLEDPDFNPGNLLISNTDNNKTKRIDLGFALADMGKIYGFAVTNFTGKATKGQKLFAISPRDLMRFPNYIIAKPYNILHFTKRDERANELQKMSVDPAFTKTAHQYFLKALLFDKNMLAPVVHEFVPDEKNKLKVSTYLDKRFVDLKIALMQVPGFRKNVITHFEEYRKNIIHECVAYNDELTKNFKDKPEEKQNKQAMKVVVIQELKDKLASLHKIIRLCEYVSQGDLTQPLDQELQTDFSDAKIATQQVLEVNYDPENKFHQYALQMAITLGADFSAEKLQKLVQEQINIKIEHLTSRNDCYSNDDAERNKNKYNYFHESILFKQLVDVTNSVGRTGELKLKQVEQLFNINQAVDNALVHLDEKKEFADLSVFLSQYSELESFAAPALNIMNQEIKISDNRKRFKMECDLALQKTMQKCNEISEKKVAGNNTELLSQISALLKECVNYGEEIIQRGDDAGNYDTYDYKVALAYLNKINAVCDTILVDSEDPKKKTVREIFVDVHNKLIETDLKSDMKLEDHSGLIGWILQSLWEIYHKYASGKTPDFTQKLWIFHTTREARLDAVDKMFAKAIECKA